MYEEAFLLLGRLIQDEKVVESIDFNAKGFRVKFTREKQIFDYPYSKMGIASFLELHDAMKANETKK